MARPTAMKRVILEMGMGNDLHGSDYTKAALRAVQDALHHSSMSLVGSLGLDIHKMQVEVTIGVQKPEAVDTAQVLAVLPHGTGTCEVVEGGLEIPNAAGTGSTVMATAAAVVWLDLPEETV